jgi:hypothetical protein
MPMIKGHQTIINQQTDKPMKKLKIGFISLITIIALNGVSYAQQSDNASASATADVLTAVDVNKNTDLVFGNVTPGNTKTISVGSSVISGIAGGTTESAAQFTVSKGANSEVILSFDLPTNLTSGSNNLEIEFADASDTKLSRLTTSEASDGENPEDFTPGSDFVTLTSADYSSYFSATEFYVWLGGTVKPTNDQAQGEYSGQITLTATYN